MVNKTEENVIQRIFLRNAVTVLCAVRRTEENVIQRKKLRNILPVLCAENGYGMQAGEHG
jgi:hypothetical protein